MSNLNFMTMFVGFFLFSSFVSFQFRLILFIFVSGGMWNGLPKAKYVIIWLLETRLWLEKKTIKMSIVKTPNETKRKEKLKKGQNWLVDNFYVCACERLEAIERSTTMIFFRFVRSLTQSIRVGPELTTKINPFLMNFGTEWFSILFFLSLLVLDFGDND